MTRARTFLIALFALAACGQPAPGADTPQTAEPFDLNIEIGRYGVMVNQAARLAGERPAAIEPDPAAPASLARALRETVWEYNLTRSRLCGRGLYPGVTCGPVYEPLWINDPASAEPTPDELRTRADAVGEEVSRLWNAVCDDARAAVQDEQERMYVCAIE